LPGEGWQGSEIEANEGGLIDVLAQKWPNFGEESSNLLSGEKPALIFFRLYNWVRLISALYYSILVAHFGLPWLEV
jgi:hypothetical protein